MQKPYACQVAGCGKRYTDPSSLRKHAKNHTDLSSPFGESRLQGCKPGRRHSSTSSASSLGYGRGGAAQQPQQRNHSVSSDYGSQKDPLELLDEAELLRGYPATVSPQLAHVPGAGDEYLHEYIPYESVARYLADERSQFALDSIGESWHKSFPSFLCDF